MLQEGFRQRELMEQPRLLELLFQHTLSLIAILDRNFNFIRVNEAYAKAAHRDVSEFPGHNHFEFYPSDAREIFKEVLRTKIPFQVFARPFVYSDHPEWGVTYLESMSPGGKMYIRTFMAEEKIVLAVQDDGKGIAQEVLEKIGTPFYTTKEYGTGLGLAVCYSIAARHKAKIDIETGPTGTTFFVRFKIC